MPEAYHPPAPGVVTAQPILAVKEQPGNGARDAAAEESDPRRVKVDRQRVLRFLSGKPIEKTVRLPI